VSIPDVEKGKKRRRRSARVYINANRPIDPEAAALIQEFPSDEDDDAPTPLHSRARVEVGKRDVSQAERRQLASEDRALPNLSYPVKTHQDAENALAHIRLGHGDVKEAKRMLRRVAREEGWSDILSALGGKTDKAAMGNAHQPDGRSLTEARVSPSRVTGQGAASVGDHGAALPPGYVPGPRETAWMHPDMRNGTVDPVPLLSMRTDANPHPRDLSGAAGVGIALSRLDAYSAAGAPGFRQQPSGNPATRPMPHIASGGPSNGGHGLADAQSHAVALKASDRVNIMRQAMFPRSGPR